MSLEDEEAPRRTEEGGEEGTPCDVCGKQMTGVHCRLICTNCGYQRDCSDL